MNQPRNNFAYAQSPIDPVLFLALSMLLAFGLVMVASASIAVADLKMADPFAHFKRQAMYVGIGVFAAFIAYRLPLALWKSLDKWLVVAMLFLLSILFVPGFGIKANGATRWLDLGPVTLQVSEAVKLLIAIYLAGYLVRHRQELRENVWAFFRPLVLVGVIVGLLILEPDMGAAIVTVSIVMGMLFMAGARFIPFVMVISTVGIAMFVLTIIEPYRVRRLLSFINPWETAASDGYQLTQSLIAIGSGSWAGVGLGASVQKMHYLPEQTNDFIFAVVAEELGLIGVAALLTLYAVVVVRGFKIGAAADMAELKFGAYLAYGISFWIGIQAVVNIGVNMGVLPTKGLILPFMSQGGSAIVVMCVAAALLFRVNLETFNSPAVVMRRTKRGGYANE